MIRPPRILVIDDERAHAESTAEVLTRQGYPVDVAGGGREGVERLAEGRYEIVITDLKMQDVDGFEILRIARDSIEDVQVIMLTGHGSVETAVRAMQQGAFTYLAKPLNIDELRTVVERAAERLTLTRENRDMHSQIDERFGFEGLVGGSPGMRKIFSVLKQAAPTDATILILGESGTGKELIAKSIHANSARKSHPFVPLHCASLGEGVLESELFGHARGAFTGAMKARQGKLESADGGTLFLDEVGDIPLATQTKLLRAIECGEITPVGSNDIVRVNVRIVAATHRNLEEHVKQGTFREDLYFRLKVIQIHLPPLRERKNDIPLLLDAFVKEYCQKYRKKIKGITPPARNLLHQYNWPGNIRELRNCVESMVVVCAGDRIAIDDLPASIAQPAPASGGAILAGMSIAAMEKQLIQETLKLTDGNRAEAARLLDIGERTLYRKLHEYGLHQGRGGHA